VRLVHVCEPTTWEIPCDGMMPLVDPFPIAVNLRHAGETALSEAAAHAAGLGLSAEAVFVDGYGAAEIARDADRNAVDLLCVGSTSGARGSSLFGGGVAKALIQNAKQSVLVAKAFAQHTGDLKLGFATDLSPYCNRCLQAFLDFQAKGVACLELLTGYQMKGHPHLNLGRQPYMSEDEIDCMALGALRRASQDKAALCRLSGYSARSFVVEGQPNRVLSQQMDKLDLDLLVIGAKGHTLWEDLTLGSVAMHEALGCPYSVMIVRA